MCVRSRVRGRRRAAWVLAGALSGLFAVHLVAGYLSNLIFAVGFLGACAAVAAGRRRATVAAALLLGAGGLAHPQFFVPGAAILALVAAWALFVRHDAGEFARLAWTVGGAAALLGAGLLSMLFGAAGLTPDTSRDGFLRRVGLGDVVRSAYVDRFVHRWTRYVQWVSLPLAGAGYLRARGTGGRILRAWLVVIVAGIPVGLLTGWFPADRLITFGYAVPILAGFGIVWLYARLSAGRAGARPWAWRRRPRRRRRRRKRTVHHRGADRPARGREPLRGGGAPARPDRRAVDTGDEGDVRGCRRRT